MATLTIASPGIQINETDQSLIVRNNTGDNVFITGFTNQGPTNEIISVTSVSELESIFGLPTNAAERYFYQSARQILISSPANLYVTRMPYGSAAGSVFGSNYTVLAYPVKGTLSYTATSDAPTFVTYANSTSSINYSDLSTYNLGEPVSLVITDAQYDTLVQGGVNWNSTFSNPISSITGTTSSITFSPTIASWSDLPKAGLVVLNNSKAVVNNLFEGTYIALADNSGNNPATDFNCVTGVRAINLNNNGLQSYITVPSTRLNFSLSASYVNSKVSISELIEKVPTAFNFGTSAYNDCLTLAVFKIRPSIYNQDTTVLDYVFQEAYTGSLYGNRKQNNPNGGSPITFNLDQVVANSNSKNIKVFTNPNIAYGGVWVDNNGNPNKSVRILGEAQNLYGNGAYQITTNKTVNDLGDIPSKLDKVLANIDNIDLSLDIVAEAGLGTIYTSSKARWRDANYGNSGTYSPVYFDENYQLSLSGLKGQSNGNTDTVATDYQSIIGKFVTFANDTRKDHIFISDPLRNIFVQGSNGKISKSSSYVFSTDVYWALRNLYAANVSSYVATYGNWLKVNDSASNSQVWVPASGWVAASMASTSQAKYPWAAPAGFNNGTLNGLIDIAINPTQKHRDLLYKINVNPIAYFPGDGYVIFGQKTLFTKPSAFDRINVRRLFLTLEKQTKNLLKFFVFEPNTFTTRTRLVNALSPIFDQAKAHEGLYDYKIVCDDRNNTPDVIDNNQLNISLYIQPVRTSEFILADFVATRTGVNFNELIG
jgi:hypothetical protein